MLSWSRPDPLTRDLVHMINARRHDHGDTEAAIDTLQAFLEQGREYDLLTVLAALDEDMVECLFYLFAEAHRDTLKQIYSQYADDTRATPLLFQPEALLIF